MSKSVFFASKEFLKLSDRSQEMELKGKTMVGFNSLWTIIISLSFLVACVPQTKQTECNTNEAFNATLRSCVPVVGGPTSFITIDNFSPALPISVHKNDSTVIPLTITVDNPYAQDYTIEWEKVYFGSTFFYDGDTTSSSFIPSNFVEELGPHFITAKIIAGGEVVDSHTFQITVSEAPRPIINTATVTPSSYAVTLTPLDGPHEFSFQVKNNNATITGAGYSTTWTLTKDGAVIDGKEEGDSFTNTSSTGTNTFYYGTSTPAGFEFDPEELGVGSYVLRAVVSNVTPGEIVGEVQWSITIKHPNKSKIASRQIYETGSSPAFSTTVVAYNGVAYSDSTAYNFIPTGRSTQGDFCVEVLDGEGTYPDDSKFVKVDFYLDNAVLVYSAETTASDDKVCLSDADASTLATVLFSNTTSTSSQSHTLVARVYDVATDSEYTSSEMNSGLGTYPIVWNFSVKPINLAPTVTFTSDTNIEDPPTSNIDCSSAVANIKNCTVTQDLSFRVGVHATDDFYSTSSTTDSIQNQFEYTMTLYRNGAVLDTCLKDDTFDTDADTPNSDFTGPDYICEFTIESFDTSGSIDPDGEDYSVEIVFKDMGSPITGATEATSTSLHYNLTVNEGNSAPTIIAQGTDKATKSYATVDGTNALDPLTGGVTATEGDTVNFMIKVSDAERDDHEIVIRKCINSTCTSLGSTLVTQVVTKADGDLTTETSLLWTIPEDFLDVNASLTTPGTQVYFKVSATDIPDDLSLSEDATDQIFTFFVLNKNPAPYFSSAEDPDADPDGTMDATDYKRILAGVPFSIDPGTVTDDSTTESEGKISYQWYVNLDRDNDDSTDDEEFEKIDGATSRILKWTPSLTHSSTVDTPTLLKLCVTDSTDVNDSTTVNPLPDDDSVDTTPVIDEADQNGSNCKGPWRVVVHSALALLNNGTRIGDNLDQDVAIWYDNKDSTYDATNGPQVVFVAASSGEEIYVDKIVIDSEGKIYSDHSDGFKTQVAEALKEELTNNLSLSGTIKNLSLTGNKSHLYLAYQATLETNTTHNSLGIMRIDKRSGNVDGIEYGEKPTTSEDSNIPFPHPGKFGIFQLSSLFAFFTSGASVTEGANGTVTIEFTNSSTLAGTIAFATSTILVDDSSGCDDDKLCQSLSDEDNAQRLASLINNYDRGRQGLTAVASGDTTTIYSAFQFQSINTLKGDIFYTLPSGGSDPHTGLTFSVSHIGKIMIAEEDGEEKWFLPYIDSSAIGSPVKVLTQETADTLDSADMLEVPLETSAGVDLKGVTWIDNQADYLTARNEFTLVATDSTNTAKAYVIDFDEFDEGSDVVVSNTLTLFSGNPISSGTLRMSSPKNADNSNYYFVAKVLDALPSDYKWKLAMYTTLSGTPTPTLLGIAESADDDDNDSVNVLDDDNIKDISIQNYSRSGVTSNEARLIVSSAFNSSNPGTEDDEEAHLYAVRFKAFVNDSSSYYFTCGECIKLNSEGSVLAPNNRVASTFVDTMTLGEAGNSTNENVKEFLFTVSATDPDGSTDTYEYDQPVFHALNMRGESIQSTTEDNSGGYRPPVIPP